MSRVNQTPDSDEGAAAQAARELAQLQMQAVNVRADLTRLHQEVEEAQNDLVRSNAGELLEVNEKLVLAALRAQADAETAARELHELSRSAELDALTGLPNRVLLLDRFERAIAGAKRHHTRLALLFLDLNNFKQINDNLGHAAGDEVLQLVARRLTAAVRKADTVSRYGGDEFLILLTDVSQASDAGHIAGKVIAILGADARVGEHALRLTASIGICIYPGDGENVEQLMERADTAMYRAKKHGLGSFVFHGEEPLSERSLEPLAPASPQHSLLSKDPAWAELERQHSYLRDANEHLVLTALDAQELKSAAEQAQRRQTEFIATLAHELRGPLTPIRTAAALVDRVNEADLPKLKAIIEGQVTHMLRLLGDVLDVSRASTGKLSLARRMVAIDTVIDAAVHTCRPAMDLHLQHLDIQAPAGALEIYGDPVRLTQVFTNLLDNASKYTPDGGEIALSVGVQDDALVTTVSDSGIGITPEILPDVFELFVQDTRAISFSGAGLGLGLTVVRELVQAHGGTVIASSAGSGLGSQFVVTLPLHRLPAGQSAVGGD